MAARLISAAGRSSIAAVFALSVALGAAPAHAADATVLGRTMSVVWVVPFAGILLSIALAPVTAPALWQRHFGKASAFWALAFVIPFAVHYGPQLAVREVVHALLAEYLPFIVLLFALYTISGGIRLAGNLRGSAALNTGVLALGTLLASVMGTTGAAMLRMRPLLRANDNRRHRAHVVVFFIFLVANIGGSLTPLGDPPLFLGFLKGVDFFWTTKAMLLPALLASSILLAAFHLLDRWLWSQDDERRPEVLDPTPESALALQGKVNFVLVAGVVLAVLMSGVWRPGIGVEVLGTRIELQNVVRDLLLLGLALASLRLTSDAVRRANGFSWHPMGEVAKLFAGIFLTIIPAVAILRAGDHGVFAPLLELVFAADGNPNDAAFFWLTGALSSFLDNAPTYLVFFNLAGADSAALTGPLASTLTAISVGAVFMGANTYIGNAPNFMVKAIAESHGVRMPSFFAYFAWAMLALLPIYALLTAVLFR